MTDRERRESLRQMANAYRANRARGGKSLPARYAKAAELLERSPARACMTYAQAAMQRLV